jgi:hypothetical protein
MLLLNYIGDEDELLQVSSVVVCAKNIALAEPVNRHGISLSHYYYQHVRQNKNCLYLCLVLGKKCIKRRYKVETVSVQLPTGTFRHFHLHR